MRGSASHVVGLMVATALVAPVSAGLGQNPSSSVPLAESFAMRIIEMAPASRGDKKADPGTGLIVEVRISEAAKLLINPSDIGATGVDGRPIRAVYVFLAGLDEGEIAVNLKKDATGNFDPMNIGDTRYDPTTGNRSRAEAYAKVAYGLDNDKRGGPEYAFAVPSRARLGFIFKALPEQIAEFRFFDMTVKAVDLERVGRWNGAGRGPAFELASIAFTAGWNLREPQLELRGLALTFQCTDPAEPTTKASLTNLDTIVDVVRDGAFTLSWRNGTLGTGKFIEGGNVEGEYTPGLKGRCGTQEIDVVVPWSATRVK